MLIGKPNVLHILRFVGWF